MIAATAVATQLSTIIQYNTTQCTMVARRGRVAMQSRWTLNRWVLSPFRKIVSVFLCSSFWTLALAVFPPPDPCPPPPDPPLLYLALVCSQGWRQLGQGGWWNASVPIPHPWGQTRAKWQHWVSHLPPLLTLDTCNPKAEEINHGS